MKLAPISCAILLLSGGLALAQNNMPPSMTVPNAPPSPANSATVGISPGVNPSNPSDLSGRSNPQDLTRQGGSNPQDKKTR